MRHYFDFVPNATTGAAIPGALVKVFDASDNLVDIFADESGTAIETVSGVANAAKTDSDGMFSLYVANGLYTVRFYQGDTVLKTIRNVELSQDVTELALGGAGGAALVGTSTGDTVEEALAERALSIDLFTSVATKTIPNPYNVIRTGGYRTAGKGGADYIYDAAVDAAWVAANPLTSVITANGRGFRLTSYQALDLFMFGAYANAASPTPSDLGDDDYPAFQAATLWMRDYMGSVKVPNGYYRVSQRWDITNRVNFYGENNGDDSGGSDDLAWPYYRQGAVLIWDADVAGIRVYPGTTIENQTTVAAGPFSSVFLYAGGARSRFTNLTLLCRSPWVAPTSTPGTYDFVANATKNFHAFDARTLTFTENIYVDGWWGDGFRLWGSTDGTPGAIPYGNVNSSTATSNRAIRCAGRGYYVGGRDANNVTLAACFAQQCGGAGYYDFTLLGSRYDACDASTCNLLLVDDTEELTPGSKTPMNGSFMVDPANLAGGSFSTFTGCYCETGRGSKSVLGINCTIKGGILGTEGYRGTNCAASRESAGIYTGKRVTYGNARGSQRVESTLGYDDATMSVFSWGSTTDGLAAHKIFYDATNKMWHQRYAASSNANPISFPGSGAAGLRTTAKGGGWGPYFNGGFTFGAIGIGTGAKQYWHTGTAAPGTGTWVRGDMLWNDLVSANGVDAFQCTFGGTPGTWVSKRMIVQQAAVTAPTGGTTIDTEARAAINALRAALTAAGVTL